MANMHKKGSECEQLYPEVIAGEKCPLQHKRRSTYSPSSSNVPKKGRKSPEDHTRMSSLSPSDSFETPPKILTGYITLLLTSYYLCPQLCNHCKVVRYFTFSCVPIFYFMIAAVWVFDPFLMSYFKVCRFYFFQGKVFTPLAPPTLPDLLLPCLPCR